MAIKDSVNKHPDRCMVFTDGGCQGNPGPGGWACIVQLPHQELVCSGGEPSTTNNRMELTAVIEGVRSARSAGGLSVEVVTDSRYVQQGITSWILRWKKNGWRTANKQPVKNRDLWMVLDRESDDLDIRWRWVAGHSGHRENERCHDLVQKEISRLL